MVAGQKERVVVCCCYYRRCRRRCGCRCCWSIHPFTLSYPILSRSSSFSLCLIHSSFSSFTRSSTRRSSHHAYKPGECAVLFFSIFSIVPLPVSRFNLLFRLLSSSGLRFDSVLVYPVLFFILERCLESFPGLSFAVQFFGPRFAIGSYCLDPPSSSLNMVLLRGSPIASRSQVNYADF